MADPTPTVTVTLGSGKVVRLDAEYGPESTYKAAKLSGVSARADLAANMIYTVACIVTAIVSVDLNDGQGPLTQAKLSKMAVAPRDAVMNCRSAFNDVEWAQLTDAYNTIYADPAPPTTLVPLPADRTIAEFAADYGLDEDDLRVLNPLLPAMPEPGQDVNVPVMAAIDGNTVTLGGGKVVTLRPTWGAQEQLETAELACVPQAMTKADNMLLNWASVAVACKSVTLPGGETRTVAEVAGVDPNQPERYILGFRKAFTLVEWDQLSIAIGRVHPDPKELPPAKITYS